MSNVRSAKRHGIFLSMMIIQYFSNSLTIHEEKTNEIIFSLKEGWIRHPNYHKIRWTFALNLKMLWEVISNASKLVEKTRLRLVFSTHFSVSGYQMKHSSSCLIYRELKCGVEWMNWMWSSQYYWVLLRQQREKSKKFRPERGLDP